MKGKNVSLPSEEEVAAVFAYYSDDYCQSLKQHSEELLVHLEQMLTLNPECDQGLSVDLREGCQDIGADAYAHVTLVDLWSLLGLSGKSVFPWGNAGGVESTQSLLPKWHQVVGTLFMLAGVYTKKLGDLPRPTLLCDDVGVGKTLQLIGLICMVVHLYEQQVLNAPPPPFVKSESHHWVTVPSQTNLHCAFCSLRDSILCRVEGDTEPAVYHYGPSHTVCPVATTIGLVYSPWVLQRCSLLKHRRGRPECY
jgi:hypothetical protein